MTHGSLFSGIGGFDLAAEWMGWENVFHCEKNPFGQRVLAHHFPESKLYEDVTTFPSSDYVGRIDILTGGFPCQPYSTAGKRLGKDDDRHLWPYMLEIIRTIQPRYVVGENVRGLVNWNDGMVFDEVQSDLEAVGYEVLPFILPAAAVDAPHRRDRVWFIAHATDVRDNRRPAKVCRTQRRQDGEELAEPIERGEVWDAAHAERNGLEHGTERGSIERSEGKTRERVAGHAATESWANFPTQSPVCGGDDGLSRELDGITFPKWRNESIKAYGNAIVPQVALQIFKAIEAYELDL